VPNIAIGWEATEGEIVKKLLLLVGLSMIGALMFAPAASATCVLSASASGSASASECNDFIIISGSGTVSASLPSGTATASTSALPGSGGLSPMLALVPLALIVGGGLLAFSIVRRR
jgi:hypothetical protein